MHVWEIKIGLKVIPHSKLGSKKLLNESPIIKTAKIRKQKYLFVRDIPSNKGDGLFTLCLDNVGRMGFHFNSSDFNLYEEVR